MKKARAYYFVAFVRKGRIVSAWHVMRLDGMTVCGRSLPVTGTFGGRLLRDELGERAKGPSGEANLCAPCDRMKDAESMRLA